MQRNAFGDPQPANYAEMIEALEERDVVGLDTWATVDIGDNQGWYASVLHNDDGEEVFETVEYDSKSDLLGDLKAASIEVP